MCCNGEYKKVNKIWRVPKNGACHKKGGFERKNVQKKKNLKMLFFPNFEKILLHLIYYKNLNLGHDKMIFCLSVTHTSIFNTLSQAFFY